MIEEQKKKEEEERKRQEEIEREEKKRKELADKKLADYAAKRKGLPPTKEELKMKEREDQIRRDAEAVEIAKK